MATIAPEIPVLARDKAFEELYRSYVKDVYHYAFALLRNPADAEDVTQTTFMNAYRAYLRGDEILKPQNWLIKIAHNVARSRYARISRRVKEVPLEDHVDQLAIPEEERPNVEGVLRALGRLPFNQRAALVMRELEGRTYAEIADTLDVSVAAVETLIFRARRSLRVRAAALRSIAVVPVPSSLTQFFEGGGFVAGGIGLGFALKAGVALVAGVLATGLGGDHGSRAVAAPDEQATPPAQAARASAAAATVSHIQVSKMHRVTKARVEARAHRRARGARATDVSPTSVSRSTPEQTGSSSPSAVTSSSPATTTATATATVSQTAETVGSTVEQVVADPTGALPVEPSALPPLPVEPPPPPKLP
jgi:RNA polymerase sigma factor (sigma-70 family)